MCLHDGLFVGCAIQVPDQAASSTRSATQAVLDALTEVAMGHQPQPPLQQRGGDSLIQGDTDAHSEGDGTFFS